MATNYLLGIFHWRDHAGDLDGPQHAAAGVRTLLWGCQRWLDTNPDAADTEEGRRLATIKAELQDWLDRHGRSGSNST
jgi:hypothetical protein